MLDFFIDDSIIGRGHRDNIWNENFTVTSVGHCDHESYLTMTVINYARDFSINETGLDKIDDLVTGRV